MTLRELIAVVPDRRKLDDAIEDWIEATKAEARRPRRWVPVDRPQTHAERRTGR